MTLTSIITIIHTSMVLLMLCIPFLPLKIIKRYYLYLIPLLLASIWLIFGGCPISFTHINEGNKTHHNLKKIFPNISEKVSDNIAYFILITIITIITYRLFQK